MGGHRLALSGLGYEQLASFCEHGNERLRSIKCGELLY
jgi:hypothetical protein